MRVVGSVGVGFMEVGISWGCGCSGAVVVVKEKKIVDFFYIFFCCLVDFFYINGNSKSPIY